MTDSKKPANDKSQKPPERDVFLTVLHAPNRESLASLLRKEMLDVGPMYVNPESNEIEVHLFIDKDQIKKLQKDGWKLDVRENLAEIGRRRQSEVGKDDRFKGGKIPPKGAGKKIGREE